MELPFALSEKKNGAIDYRIHPLFSAGSLCISLILLAASTLFGPPAIAGLALAFFALLGALYTERWAFDGKAGAIAYVTGFRPILKRFDYATSDAVSVTLSVFAKGELDQRKANEILESIETGVSARGLFRGALPFAPESRIRLRLSMEFANGDTVLIDETGIRSKARLKALASRIESACGIPSHTGS